jgi:hypothetical protein
MIVWRFGVGSAQTLAEIFFFLGHGSGKTSGMNRKSVGVFFFGWDCHGAFPWQIRDSQWKGMNTQVTDEIRGCVSDWVLEPGETRANGNREISA